MFIEFARMQLMKKKITPKMKKTNSNEKNTNTRLRSVNRCGRPDKPVQVEYTPAKGGQSFWFFHHNTSFNK